MCTDQSTPGCDRTGQVDFTWNYHKSQIQQTMCLYEEDTPH